jgi:GT2 family glycosyltransferase
MAASKMLFADRADTIDRVGDGYSRAGAGILRGRNAPADAFSQGEWIFGACAGAAMYRMDMLKRIGCFDPTFFLLYEDVDLSFRAQLAGYKCRYVPDALVYHRSCATIGRDSAVSVYFGHRNGEWVYFRNMPIGLIQKSFLLHFRYIVLSGLYFLSRRLGAVYFQAKKDAFAALPGILQQRAGIQMSRKIKDTDLWELFSPDQPLDRLRSRRIRITS